MRAVDIAAYHDPVCLVVVRVAVVDPISVEQIKSVEVQQIVQAGQEDLELLPADVSYTGNRFRVSDAECCIVVFRVFIVELPLSNNLK